LACIIANKLPRTIVSSKSLNYCTKKQKKDTYILDGPRGSKLTANLQFCVNYPFKTKSKMGFMSTGHKIKNDVKKMTKKKRKDGKVIS